MKCALYGEGHVLKCDCKKALVGERIRCLAKYTSVHPPALRWGRPGGAETRPALAAQSERLL